MENGHDITVRGLWTFARAAVAGAALALASQASFAGQSSQPIARPVCFA